MEETAWMSPRHIICSLIKLSNAVRARGLTSENERRLW